MKPMLWAVLAVLLCWLLAAQAEPLDFIGSGLWGSLDDAVVQGHYAYCSMPYGIGVVDIEDPANLRWVAQCHTPALRSSDSYSRMAVAGNRLYASCKSEGDATLDVAVCDISDPLHPEYLSPIQLERNGVVALAADPRGYAYVHDFIRGVVIVDCRGTGEPIEVGLIPRRGQIPSACVLRGTELFVIESDSLYIYDVSDPAQPDWLGTVWMGPITGAWEVGADQFVVEDDYVYVACVFNGLRIFNVSDPTHPVLSGIYTNATAAYGEVFLVDAYAYCYELDAQPSIHLLDITNPAAPVQIGVWSQDFMVRSVSNGVACAVRKQNGNELLAMLNVSQPLAPYIAGSLDLRSELPKQIEVAGDAAYVACYTNRLKVVDLSVPWRPVQTATLYNARNLAIANGFLYTADPDVGLKIWDLTDPLHPQPVGAYGGSYAGVAVSANYLYTTNLLTYRMELFEVSDASYPVLLDSFALSGVGAFARAIDGNRLYLTGAGFSIWNIFDREHPVQVSDYHDPLWVEDEVFDFQARGSLVAFAYQGCGMQLVDASNPDALVRLSAYRYDVDLMTGAHISGDRAVAGCINRGIRLLDISAPNNPLEIAGCDRYGPSTCVYIDDRFALMANEANLVVLENLIAPNSTPARPAVDEFRLEQNYPNPFNATTVIRYSLERAADVRLGIFNVLGQKVAEPVQEIQSAGVHKLSWSAESLPSGIYWARLEAGGNMRTVKMVLLK